MDAQENPVASQTDNALAASNETHTDPVRQAISSICAWAKLLRSGDLSGEQRACAIAAIEHNACVVLEQWPGTHDARDEVDNGAPERVPPGPTPRRR
jgi:hypothetical protein